MILHYKILTDNPLKPWLVLLHGLFGMGDNLLGIAKVMQASHQVLLLDLTNHGKSPHCEHMTFASMAQDIIDTFDALKLSEPCILLGHSLGGKVLMEVALRHANRVKALIVADIAPVAYKPNDEHLQALRGILQVETQLANIQSRRDADALLTNFVDDVIMRQFLLKSLVKNEQGSWHWSFNAQALQQNYLNFCVENMADFVCDKPCLFLKGANSKYIRKAHESEMLARFPQYQLQTIENAGHWLHVEQPELFMQAVLAFLMLQ